MSDALSRIWAKSAAPGHSSGESLAAHTGWVLGGLADWRQRLSELAGRTRADLWDLVAWACLLHDVGKVARGFQDMLRGGSRFNHRHEVLSLVAVGWLDVCDEAKALIAAGVATHHKDWRDVRLLYRDIDERKRLLAEMAPADEQDLRAWLAGQGAPDIAHLGFAPLPRLRAIEPIDALADAFRLLRALAKDIEAIGATDRLAVTVRSVRGLVLLADHAGSAHERLPEPRSLGTPAAFLKAAPFLSVPLPAHQEVASQIVGHCLLAAPTGSGKTEAALLWAAHQREVAAAPRTVFYVLPYRASLNAMQSRMIAKYGLARDQVVLQHSSATTALYTQLLDRKDYSAAKAEAVARRNRALGWLMTAPIRVLTPYQLLRGFFGLKGHEAVLTDAANGVFVLDELHAYEPERLALILTAVQHLARDLGATFLAMSATFPSVLRALLCETLGHVTEIQADRDTKDAARRHVLWVVERDLLSAETMTEAAARQRHGEAVLVVATTVARAQEAYDVLVANAGREHVNLLHGRFTGRDRARKEANLLARVANGRTHQGEPGTILVATQVVEVSLDVDFDVLYSDPGPVEALVQRFGRVNRGRRGPLRDVVVHAVPPPSGRYVYEEATVMRAIDTLRAFSGSAIEEDNVQAWVDAAYEPIAAAFVDEILRRMAANRSNVVETNLPLESHDELKAAFDKQFDGTEVVPLSLRTDYERMLENDPLNAPGFRVPVSRGQWHKLHRAGRLVDSEFADCAYSNERGLDLSFPDDNA